MGGGIGTTVFLTVEERQDLGRSRSTCSNFGPYLLPPWYYRLGGKK